MSHDDEHVAPDDLGDYVPLMYARSLREAEKCRQLLEDHDVPAVVDKDYEPKGPAEPGWAMDNIPVLVPEAMLEDASQFLAEIEEKTTLADDEDGIYDDEDDEDLADDRDPETKDDEEDP